MPNSKDFYRRFILSCFSRKAGAPISVAEIREDANFAIKGDEIAELWPTLQELVEEGLIEYDQRREVYIVKSYTIKPRTPPLSSSILKKNKR